MLQHLDHSSDSKIRNKFQGHCSVYRLAPQQAVRADQPVMRLNTSMKDINMTMWNKLPAVPDRAAGFPNKASSARKKLQQGYDNETGEQLERSPKQFITSFSVQWRFNLCRLS
jgi:hypothetical protein